MGLSRVETLRCSPAVEWSTVPTAIIYRHILPEQRLQAEQIRQSCRIEVQTYTPGNFVEYFLWKHFHGAFHTQSHGVPMETFPWQLKLGENILWKLRGDHVCYTPVRLSSVCNVHTPYFADWSFQQFFYVIYLFIMKNRTLVHMN